MGNMMGDRMGNNNGNGGRGQGSGDRSEAPDDVNAYDTKSPQQYTKGAAVVTGFAPPRDVTPGQSIVEIQGEITTGDAGHRRGDVEPEGAGEREEARAGLLRADSQGRVIAGEDWGWHANLSQLATDLREVV